MDFTGNSCHFDNTTRQGARTSVLLFNSSQQAITLRPAAYLIDFKETVRVPRNCMTSIYPRSSLWRSGVNVGYEGALGTLVEVKNPHGVVLFRDAKLAQIVFELRETVEVYNSIYQASTASNGRDGPARDRWRHNLKTTY
jgi:dUTP pyrophosphatase